MPRLAAEGPDARVLRDIQTHIGPLITKRVIEDGTKLSSLGMRNKLRLLEAEILAMPIYFAKVESIELTKEEYERCVMEIRAILDLLENIIVDGIMSTAEEPEDSTQEEQENDFASAWSARKYPKLAFLRKQLATSSDSEDPGALSKFLQLSDTLETVEEANRVFSSFNESNNCHLEAVIPKVNSFTHDHEAHMKPAHKRRVRDSNSTYECLSEVWRTIAQRLTCKAHAARVQALHPGASSKVDDGIQHKVFISGCEKPDDWQETVCRICKDLPPEISINDLEEERDICKRIKKSLILLKKPDIIIHNSRVFRLKGAGRVSLPQALPTLPLADMLNKQGRNLRRYHKIILALNLSHSLLRMHHGAKSSVWTSKSVFFLLTGHRIIEAYNPYVPFQLALEPVSESRESAYTRKYPLLVAFGRLLLEIALGRPIQDAELNELCTVVVVSLDIIMRKQDEEIRNNVTKGYCKAMTKCIQSNKDDDYDDSDVEESEKEDADKEDDYLEEVIVSVIEHLERDRDEFPKFENYNADWEQPNFPMELELEEAEHAIASNMGPASTNTIMETNGTFQSKVTRVNNRVPESPHQLFDATSRNEKDILAESFMRQADSFYVDYIEDLPKDRRIRIAILDTGIDEFNPIVRALCRGTRRSRRPSPFQSKRSFVGGSTRDEFGHGTEVAALILKLAPEADLYIAKISEGKEDANAYQIAQAIEWAHECKVDIISMSFGMRENNAEIERAIGNAENDGVIMFAAASNYGGNQGRAFPARMDKVICVHSSDGNGNRSSFSPSPVYHENFSTLGEGIESVYSSDTSLSGTSYATPIFAGIAANVLTYVWNCSEIHRRYKSRAFSRTGMRKLMAAMSQPRDGYDYVTPGRNLWTPLRDDSSPVIRIAARIEDALREDR